MLACAGIASRVLGSRPKKPIPRVSFGPVIRYSFAMSPTPIKGRDGGRTSPRRIRGPGSIRGGTQDERVPPRERSNRPDRPSEARALGTSLGSRHPRALRDDRPRSSPARPGAAGLRTLARVPPGAGRRRVEGAKAGRARRRSQRGAAEPRSAGSSRPGRAGRDVASGGASSNAEVRRSLVFEIPIPGRPARGFPLDRRSAEGWGMGDGRRPDAGGPWSDSRTRTFR